MLYTSPKSRDRAEEAGQEGRDPGDGALPENNIVGPFSPELPPDGSDGGNAGGIKKAENQEGNGRAFGKHGRAAGKEHLHGGYDALLGHEAAYQRGHDAPVPEADRIEYGGNEARDGRKDAVMRILHEVESEIKALQEPDHDRGDQDHGEGAVQEVLGLFPHKLAHVARGGQAVIGQFHHEGHRVAAEERLAVDQRRQHAREDSQEIEPGNDQPGVPREKGVDEKAVDGQLCGAGHEGCQQDRHAAVPVAGQRPCGHDRGHRAAEAD